MDLKNCSICHVEKNIDEFVWLNKTKGIKKSCCKKCYNAKTKSRNSYKIYNSNETVNQKRKEYYKTYSEKTVEKLLI